MSRSIFVLLLLIALGLVALGSLTSVKSPDWSAWKLALVAGEFGHLLAIFAFAVGLGVWFTRGGVPGLWVTAALALPVLAIGLFLKPVIQAGRIARSLPGDLTRELGRVELARPAFSFPGLFAARPPAVLAKTQVYASGLSLDFYPAAARPNAPCVLLVHGGGWDSGTREEIAHFNHWLVGRGYAVAAIDYRLAPQFPWPAQRDDLAAAIVFLKSNAAALGIDATRLVLLGRSAGGQLAEAAAYAAPDPAIRGVVALYAPADVHFAWEFGRDDDVLNSPQLLKNFLGGTPATARGSYDSASPILYAGKSAPPTLLIHGRLDTLVWHRQSERLTQKLQEAGVKHAFVSLPWATHAFDYNLKGPGGQLSTYAIEWFLASVTK